MSEWVPEYLLRYNLSPKPSPIFNKPDPLLQVGTEDAIRYLATAYHAISEIKRLYSEGQLHDNRLEVGPDPTTPFSVAHEIEH